MFNVTFEKGVHAPLISVNGSDDLAPIELKAGFGERMRLDARKTWSVDERELVFKWFQYKEPSATQWNVDFQVANLLFEDMAGERERPFEVMEVTMPQSEAGYIDSNNPEVVKYVYGPRTYHFVLEVVNSATTPMRTYKRFVVSVQ